MRQRRASPWNQVTKEHVRRSAQGNKSIEIGRVTMEIGSSCGVVRMDIATVKSSITLYHQLLAGLATNENGGRYWI